MLNMIWNKLKRRIIKGLKINFPLYFALWNFYYQDDEVLCLLLMKNQYTEIE